MKPAPFDFNLEKTGIGPWDDLVVRRAWKVYTDDAMGNPDYNRDSIALRAAKILDRHAGGRPRLVALALLSDIAEAPRELFRDYGIAPRAIAHLHDFKEMEGTGYTGILKSQDPVRLLCLARAAAMLEMYGEDDGRDPPSTDACKRLASALAGKTSSRALEKLFAARLREHLSGVHADFSRTQLLDSPLVRRAFNALAADPRTEGRHFEDAVSTAELLSRLPDLEGAATAVAIALIDVGLPSRKPAGEAPALARRLRSKETSEILRNHRLAEIRDAAQLLAAPLPVRQAALAHETFIMAMSGQTLAAALPNGRGRIGLRLRAARSLVRAAQARFAPALGRTGSKALEDCFCKTWSSLSDFVTQAAPRKTGHGLKPV